MSYFDNINIDGDDYKIKKGRLMFTSDDDNLKKWEICYEVSN
jgi:hypothetical protein